MRKISKNDSVKQIGKFPVLEVKNFSCIKDMSVTFARIVVLIGEQAAGKSVTSKLYYFFTGALQKVMERSLMDGETYTVFCKNLEREFKSIFPESAWEKVVFTIKWYTGSDCLCVKNSLRTKKVTFRSDGYRNRYEKCLDGISKKRKKETANTLKPLSRMSFPSFQLHGFVRKIMRQEFPSLYLIYVPAGRSFFSVIQSSVFSLLANDVGIDYFLKLFGQILESIRRLYVDGNNGIGMNGIRMSHQIFHQACELILHGKYEFDGKEQWIVADAGRKVRLADASSGQQEALPLLMILAHFAQWTHDKYVGSARVIIEEPEAHLYPLAQQKVVDFLADNVLVNKCCGSIITTHSPFILCCINNVLKRMKDLRGDVAAYHVHDGTCDPIFDAEYGLINAERFDRISEEIANA